MRKNIAFGCVGLAVLAGLYSTSQPPDPALRRSTVALFENLRALDVERDRELLSLRYGLSFNYDRLRLIEEQEHAAARDLSAALLLVPGATGAGARTVFSAFQEDWQQKAAEIEDFATENALLRNSLANLPRVADELTAELVSEDLGALARELQALEGLVFRYSLTGDANLERECVAAMDGLHGIRGTLAPALDRRLGLCVFHAATVLESLARTDDRVRELLAASVTHGLAEAQDQFELAQEQLHQRSGVLRSFLVGIAAVFMVYVAWTLSKLKRLNRRIEQEVEVRTRDLEREREQFRSLAETTSAIPWKWSVQTGCFEYVGPQAEALLGFPLEAWLQKDFLAGRIHDDDRAGALDYRDALKHSQASMETEFRCLRRDERELFLRCIARASTDTEGKPILQGFLLDITDERALSAELQQAQKLESVGRLAAGVAHEINTPVQFLSDNGRFLKQSFEDLIPVLQATQELTNRLLAEETPPEDATSLSTLLDAADLEFLLEEVPAALNQSIEGTARVGEIVRAMKEFSHPGMTSMSMTSVNRALASTVTVARNEWKYVAELTLDLDPELPEINCFAGELNQAFLNIVVNAAHAIGDRFGEGSEEGSEGSSMGLIHISTKAREDGVEIRIRDNGGGIPVEAQGKLFDPFFTTKGVGRGTGQGLAISHRVVTGMHDGTIEFETEIGVGTTFVLWLPFDSSAVRAADAAA